MLSEIEDRLNGEGVMDWNEQSEQELHRLWNEGVKISDIARHFQVTRNTIVGKAHRLGMKGPQDGRRYEPKPKDRRDRKERRVTPKPRPPRAVKPKFEMKPLPQVPREPRPVAVPDTVHINGAVALTDLKDCHCRWPLWDDRRQQEQRLFCGQVRIDRSQYCLHHWERSKRSDEDDVRQARRS